MICDQSQKQLLNPYLIPVRLSNSDITYTGREKQYFNYHKYHKKYYRINNEDYNKWILEAIPKHFKIDIDFSKYNKACEIFIELTNIINRNKNDVNTSKDFYEKNIKKLERLKKIIDVRENYISDLIITFMNDRSLLYDMDYTHFYELLDFK